MSLCSRHRIRPCLIVLLLATLLSEAEALAWSSARSRDGTEGKYGREIAVLAPKYTIGSALRYLSRAVFTDALVRGSAESIFEDLRSSNLQDSSDCVKRLLCDLHGQSRQRRLAWDEELILNAIPSFLDYTSPILQFHLAVDLGQKRPDQCSVVYNRCSLDATEIIQMMRQRGTSLDLKTEDNYDCTVLFLWNKKQPTATTTSTTTEGEKASTELPSPLIFDAVANRQE